MSTFEVRSQPAVALTIISAGCKAPMFVCLLAIVVAAQSGIASERPKGRPERNRRSAEFSVCDDGDFLLLPVTIGPTEQVFFLDTGTSHSVCDSKLVHLLGRRLRQIKGTTPDGGQIRSMLHELPSSVSINGLGFPTSTAVAVYDLSPLRRLSGHELAGAVGMDFLRNHVVEINLDLGKVSFHTTIEPANQPPLAIRWVDDGIPSVKFLAGSGRSVDFAIDTGLSGVCTSGLLSRKTVSRLLDAGDATEVTQKGYTQTLAGTTRGRAWRVSSLSIGEITIRDAIFAEGVRDIVGLRLFVHMNATLDFPNGKLYVKPSRRVTEVDVPSTSGLHIWRIKGATCVHSVDTGSRGALASIQPDDTLLKVGDTTVSTSRLYTLRAALERNKTPVSLELRRGPKIYRTDLPPNGGK